MTIGPSLSPSQQALTSFIQNEQARSQGTNKKQVWLKISVDDKGNKYLEALEVNRQTRWDRLIDTLFFKNSYHLKNITNFLKDNVSADALSEQQKDALVKVLTTKISNRNKRFFFLRKISTKPLEDWAKKTLPLASSAGATAVTVATLAKSSLQIAVVQPPPLLPTEARAVKAGLADKGVPRAGLAQAASTVSKTTPMQQTLALSNLEIEVSQFWETFFTDKEFHNISQIIILCEGEAKEKAETILDSYIEKQQENTPSFSITNEAKKIILESLIDQIKYNDHVSDTKNQMTTTTGKTLHIFETKGDGSCGLHALLGAKDASGVYVCDAKANRMNFSQWLQKKHEEKALPIGIQIVLADYFRNFDKAPKDFRKAIENMHKQYHKNYDSLSNTEKDTKTEEFISNKKVMQAYCNSLEKTGNYLLQEELLASAEYFRKTILLYQPGWGTESGKLTCNELPAGSQNVVTIFYNGVNHYERAELQP